MKCEFCGKDGANEVIDPYLLEINEETVLRWFCEECEAERRLEI